MLGLDGGPGGFPKQTPAAAERCGLGLRLKVTPKVHFFKSLTVKSLGLRTHREAEQFPMSLTRKSVTGVIVVSPDYPHRCTTAMRLVLAADGPPAVPAFVF